jgi:peptide-methionine (R)-S-oxide reductase
VPRIDRRSVLTLIAAAAVLPVPALALDTDHVVLPDAVWKKRLSPEAYQVLRHEDTEVPFSSPLDHETRPGTYRCAGCDLALYSSKTKYDSGTGWPSFWAPLPHAIAMKSDNALVEERTEVHCRRCDGHLGHVFDDGPPPTGKRYCMNGVALKFVFG